jgi:hypothetical protein
MKQLRDLPPGSKRQQPKAFGFELEKDQLLFGEQALNRGARPRGAWPNQSAVNRLVNRSQG